MSGAQPEIRNGRAVLGVWEQSPQPPEARGFGGGAPSALKFCIFLQILLNFRAIFIKNNAFKRGIEITSAT